MQRVNVFEANSPAGIDWPVVRQTIDDTGWVQIKNLIPNNYLDEVELAYLTLLHRFGGARFTGFAAPGLIERQDFNDAVLRFKAEQPRSSGAVYDAIQCSIPVVRLSTCLEVVGAVAHMSGTPAHSLSNFNHGLMMAAPNDERHFIGWHQDTFNDEAYHDYRSGITAWMPMALTGQEDGALIVCPGSHLQRVERVAKTKGVGASLSYELPEDYLAEFEHVQVTANRGDAIFFSMNIAHTAGVNTSPRVRYTLQTRYFPMPNPQFVPGKPIYKSSLL
jgi:hypothetical protein